ncbi:hypothetical protein CYMTET_29053, partial [Cymbomonas tetramitiformis]
TTSLRMEVAYRQWRSMTRLEGGVAYPPVACMTGKLKKRWKAWSLTSTDTSGYFPRTSISWSPNAVSPSGGTTDEESELSAQRTKQLMNGSSQMHQMFSLQESGFHFNRLAPKMDMLQGQEGDFMALSPGDCMRHVKACHLPSKKALYGRRELQSGCDVGALVPLTVEQSAWDAPLPFLEEIGYNPPTWPLRVAFTATPLRPKKARHPSQMGSIAHSAEVMALVFPALTGSGSGQVMALVFPAPELGQVCGAGDKLQPALTGSGSGQVMTLVFPALTGSGSGQEVEGGSEDGWPLNPKGRTGIRGAGLFKEVGPVHSVMYILTRTNDEGGLEVLLLSGDRETDILRLPAEDEEDAWGLPGKDRLVHLVAANIQQHDSSMPNAAEEQCQPPAGSVRSRATRWVECLEASAGECVYEGYLDDTRNTDNAWREVTVIHLPCLKRHVDQLWLPAQGSTEDLRTGKVQWRWQRVLRRSEKAGHDSGMVLLELHDHLRAISFAQDEADPAMRCILQPRGFIRHAVVRITAFRQLLRRILQGWHTFAQEQVSLSELSHTSWEERLQQLKMETPGGDVYPLHGKIRFGNSSNEVPWVRVHKNIRGNQLHFFLDAWQKDLQKAKVLLSVTGGAKDFQVRRDLKKGIAAGLSRAARAARALITTGGLHAGVMRLVGQAMADSSSHEDPDISGLERLTPLGVASWQCVAGHKDLEEAAISGKTLEYIPEKYQGGANSAPLDPNHGMFIFADSGFEPGGWGDEIQARDSNRSCR